MDSFNKNNKYGLTKLRKTMEEFKFVKNFFDTCCCKEFVGMYNYSEEYFKIYKISEQQPKTPVQQKKQSNNLMLLHGTPNVRAGQ